MSFKILISIRHFQLDDLDLIDTPSFSVTNHASKKDEMLDLEFKQMVGIKANNSFRNNSLAYMIVPKNGNANFVVEMHNLFLSETKSIETFLLFLWFIKDNSVSMDEAYGQFKEEKRWAWWTNHLVYSNSDGTFKDVKFSKDEIFAATELLLKFTKICPKRIKEAVFEDAFDDKKETTLKSGYGRDIIDNNIERAIAFLNTARGTPHLPQKITHYMSILECLFTLDAIEVVQKVSERTAYYIGENKEDRLSIYKTIKDAYDIRSKFVHGQKIKKDFDFICSLSTKVDEVIRKVLNKIILTDHSNFSQKEAELTKYLSNLIFQ